MAQPRTKERLLPVAAAPLLFLAACSKLAGIDARDRWSARGRVRGEGGAADGPVPAEEAGEPPREGGTFDSSKPYLHASGAW
jgi:hypothetical protein